MLAYLEQLEEEFRDGRRLRSMWWSAVGLLLILGASLAASWIGDGAKGLGTRAGLRRLVSELGPMRGGHRIPLLRPDEPELGLPDRATLRAPQLEAALSEYTGTRSAAAEITTGLITLGTGAIVFQNATPGAIALGPVIAGSIAQGAAISSFPLGATAGGIWYGLFPAQAAPFLIAGATAGVLGVAAVATAFAGIVSDPVQRALGLHRRRLARFIDGLEGSFYSGDAAGFRAYDLYVARLMDLIDLLVGVTRNFRAG